ILPEFLPRELFPESAPPAAGAVQGEGLDLVALVDELLPREDGRLHAEVINAVERVLFTRVLRHTHGHQARASELPGLNRSTLRHRLRTLGLGIDKMPTDAAREE